MLLEHLGKAPVVDPSAYRPPTRWNFPLTVYGFERSEASMKKITRRLSKALGSHLDDKTAA